MPSGLVRGVLEVGPGRPNIRDPLRPRAELDPVSTKMFGAKYRRDRYTVYRMFKI